MSHSVSTMSCGCCLADVSKHSSILAPRPAYHMYCGSNLFTRVVPWMSTESYLQRGDCQVAIDSKVKGGCPYFSTMKCCVYPKTVFFPKERGWPSLRKRESAWGKDDLKGWGGEPWDTVIFVDVRVPEISGISLKKTLKHPNFLYFLAVFGVNPPIYWNVEMSLSHAWIYFLLS